MSDLMTWCGPMPPSPDRAPTLREATEEFRRCFVLAALSRNRGDLRAAARELGIGYSTMKGLRKRTSPP